MIRDKDYYPDEDEWMEYILWLLGAHNETD